MARDFSSEGLLDFLREAALRGSMHPATARSRRKAAEALLSQLSDDEASDLRRLDFATLRSRLAGSPTNSLRPEVADLYAERLAAALDDYRQALESRAARMRTPADAAGAPSDAGAASDTDEGAAMSRAMGETVPRGAAPGPSALREEDLRALESVRLSLDRQRTDVFPIPLARDRVVFLHGLPHDLTDAEARKIGRVVRALAGDGDESEDPGDAL
jgi:hypothetical protein